MDFSSLRDLPVIDCHVHFRPDAKDPARDIAAFDAFSSEVMAAGRLSQMYLSGDWSAICLKARKPGRFYAGAAVAWGGTGDVVVPKWKQELEDLMAAGFDGVGEMGSKPAPRDTMNMLAGPYYTGFWRYCDSRRVPVLCHVADPEEFWDDALAPAWAREQGWTYDSRFPTKRELHDDLATVLGRHPEMSIVVAHFGFLSADIDAAGAFFGRYAHAALDLAPGIELLWNMSAARDRWREFFVAHQDRILFGTDIAPWQSVPEALARIWTVRTFLESDGEFVTPPEADRLMTRYDRPFRGLGLPHEVLAKIYAGNFQRVFGRSARPIDTRSAARIALREVGPVAEKLLSQVGSGAQPGR